MSWRNAIRNLIFDSDVEERSTPSDSWAQTTEVLELRMVLGSLSTSLPSTTSDVTHSDATQVNSLDPLVNPNSEQQSPTSPNGTPLTTSTSLLSDPQPNSTSNVTALSEDVSNATTPVTLLNSPGDLDSSEIVFVDWTSNDNSTAVPSSFPASSKPETTSYVVDVNPLATDSALTSSNKTDSSTPSLSVSLVTNPNGDTVSQTSSASGGSNTSGPPTAIDLSMTAVNSKVFVNSDVVASARIAGLNNTSDHAVIPDWFANPSVNAVIRYDFRDSNGIANQISGEQIQAAERVMQEWSAASNGRILFVRDMTAAIGDIVNIGVGDMSAVGEGSNPSTVLGSSNHALRDITGSQTSVGTIWLNQNTAWSIAADQSTATSGTDFETVMAHEIGHILGLEHDSDNQGIMRGSYTGRLEMSQIATSFQNPTFFSSQSADSSGFFHDNLSSSQLTVAEVIQLLNRASVATPSEDAIIAIVDRNGNILGVRQEQGVINTITDPSTLAFATDGAVSMARTAAFFANDTAPLTSRTIENLSQTTILEREVEANPNSSDPTVQGPGFVAPIGIGGHFPAGVEHVPPVDLFNIEASNRDSTIIPGTERFNINLIDIAPGQTLPTPISYGTWAGMPGDSQNRGIATLPGGLPIYRTVNGTPELIGGIGVFFPGPDGYATHQQGFVPDAGQTLSQRMNSEKSLEAEVIAFAAIGGSPAALAAGVNNAVINEIGGFAPVAGINEQFGFITLNGIALAVIGPTPGTKGPNDLIAKFKPVLGTGSNSGTSQFFDGSTIVSGNTAPSLAVGQQIIGTDESSGYLVDPHTSASSALTVADMEQIINAGVAAADQVRAAIRLGTDRRTGATTRMTLAITDLDGNVLTLYRMEDGTVFSSDVAVAKARNVTYYASNQLASNPEDRVPLDNGSGQLVPLGTAFTNRTFRFLAEPRFPSGVDGTPPPEFSILNDALAANIDPATGENRGAPADASVFDSVMGHDVFNPQTNFHQTPSANQNGIIFFPGSTPLYKNGVLVGGLGVSGDGVDQDDIVTFLAAQGYLPDGFNVTRSDEVFVDGVRLPYQKFDRNPFGGTG